LGESYLLNEYRAAWKVGGAPLAQRLADKKHSWEDLQALIPEITLQGIMGYPFSCPDMIGGGQIDSFTDQSVIDQELVVRSAQCHVFMPMMQFSVNPFRILDQTHIQAIKDAVDLRQKFVPKIVELVKHAAITGQPIVRMMDYEFPNQGFESVNDQFMLGDKYLIAPVVQKGAIIRKVVLPKGRWENEKGEKFQGGKIVNVPVELKSIPFFIKSGN
jgi:alpha-glucosidase